MLKPLFYCCIAVSNSSVIKLVIILSLIILYQNVFYISTLNHDFDLKNHNNAIGTVHYHIPRGSAFSAYEAFSFH